MKKLYYVLLYSYSWMVLFVIFHYFLRLFGYNWSYLLERKDILVGLIFLFLMVTLSITLASAVLLKLFQLWQQARLQQRLKSILKGQRPQKLGQAVVDKELDTLSQKLTQLTKAVQLQENQSLQVREEVVQEERKRIARELHDTVSQELFAANMMLAGAKSQVQDQSLSQQFATIGQLLDTAQNDLRILMLQLRPRELENRNLVDGMKTLLQEVEERSPIQITFIHEVEKLPHQIEEHLFRILQEFISNTLRHAHASRLEVYLVERNYEVQLKLVDDGIGFDPNHAEHNRYGLRNIEDRIQDMAGSYRLLTAPKQGVSLDIRIPLLEKDKEE